MTYSPQIKVATHYKRLDNSQSGNPRYRIFFKDGAIMDTERDTSWAYLVETRDFYHRQCVWVINEYAQIVHAQPIWGC